MMLAQMELSALRDPTGDWRQPAAAEYTEKRRRLVTRLGELTAKLERYRGQAAEVEREIEQLDRAAKTFGLDVAAGEMPSSPSAATERPRQPRALRAGRQFKDAAADFVKSRYPNAARSPEVQAAVESELGRQFHPKTAGMTLYRLMRDGTVRRDGWDWYWVPENERQQK